MESILVFTKILLLFETIAFIVGVVSWKKVRNSYWKWFTIYLGFIISVELLSTVLNFCKINNQPLFAYFVIPAEFLFFYWLFYVHSIGKERRVASIGVLIYILSFFSEKIFFSNQQKYFFTSSSYSVGNVILLILIIQYFVKLTNSNRILLFFNERLFWVSCGLLLFYLGTFPYYSLNNFLYYNYQPIFWRYTYIMYFLNCSMYLLFAASFIWGEKEK